MKTYMDMYFVIDVILAGQHIDKPFFNSTLCFLCGMLLKVRSGQIWGHTPEQRVAASTLRRYSIDLRLAITEADARPVMRIPSIT